MPSKSVDMIFCDLPFGTTQNKWDCQINLSMLWYQYERIAKPNAAIVLNSQGLFTAKLILSNERLFKYRVTWIKSKATNFLNAKKQPLRKVEDICVFYAAQPTYNPQKSAGLPYDKGLRKSQQTGSYGHFNASVIKNDCGDRYPTDVVYFKTAESEGEVWHPTQKPVELARYFIRTYTNPGDVVLDNACGSGTYLFAAAIEKRNFIGIEKNAEAELFKDKKINLIELAKSRLFSLNYNSKPVK